MPCGLLTVLLVGAVDVRRDEAIIAPDAPAARVRRSDVAMDVDATGAQHLAVTRGEALVETKGECPLENPFKSNGQVYADGNLMSGAASDERVVLGFKPENAKDCETCGYTGSTVDGRWTREYGFNYLWNAKVGLRSFWEDPARGYERDASAWWGEGSSCPEPYKKEYKVHKTGVDGYLKNLFTGEMWCKLPDNVKFLGESCKKKEDCVGGGVHLSKYLDTTCAPTSNDPNDLQLKCMMDEEAKGAYAGVGDVCDCTGFFFCVDDEKCHGNMCVLSTGDMKKHCKPTDEETSVKEMLGLTEGQCSNCRSSENHCVHPDGLDIWDVDTSQDAISAGAVFIQNLQ